MCPINYYTNMRHCKEPKLLRLEMVRFARERGVKPAARAFRTTPKTVRKWLKRWCPGSLQGLENQSKAPKCKKLKINPKQREQAIELKRKLKSWGASRIKRNFDLKISEKAIRKIWREEGLLKRKRPKPKTKNDLRKIKAQWRLFEQVDLDVKYLFDIPEYWPQMMKYNLPRYQYTAREVVSGLMFIGYAAECTLTYTTLFAQTIINHLIKCGIDLENCRFQTDNGSEFIGAWGAKEPSLFTKTVERLKGLQHHTIPPAAHTYQADVETVHRLIEDEFFEVESFNSYQTFLQKTNQYVLWFNIARKNSYKNNQTPWDIIHLRNPTIDPHIALMPALPLDYLLKIDLDKSNKRGYDLIQYPYSSSTEYL